MEKTRTNSRRRPILQRIRGRFNEIVSIVLKTSTYTRKHRTYLAFPLSHQPSYPPPNIRKDRHTSPPIYTNQPTEYTENSFKSLTDSNPHRHPYPSPSRRPKQPLSKHHHSISHQKSNTPDLPINSPATYTIQSPTQIHSQSTLNTELELRVVLHTIHRTPEFTLILTQPAQRHFTRVHRF